MSLEAKCDQEVEILEPDHNQASTLGLKRRYRKTRSVMTHVRPIPPAQAERLRLTGFDIDHNLWFYSDPEITVQMRLRWLGKILRPNGDSINCHKRDVVWTVGAKLLSIDNEDVTVVP